MLQHSAAYFKNQGLCFTGFFGGMPTPRNARPRTVTKALTAVLKPLSGSQAGLTALIGKFDPSGALASGLPPGWTKLEPQSVKTKLEDLYPWLSPEYRQE